MESVAMDVQERAMSDVEEMKVLYLVESVAPNLYLEE
jgi:hypothetical protein